MNWILSALTLGSIVLAVVALATAVLRKWELARRTARWACSFAFAVLTLCAMSFVLMIFAPRLVGKALLQFTPVDDPGERARVLAQVIAELMNGSALAVPVLILAVPIWLIARNRLKAAAVAARGASPGSGSAS